MQRLPNLESLEEQISPLGRTYRKSGLKLDHIKKIAIHEFIYTDKKEGFFYVYMDYFNNFVKITFK